MEQKTIPVHCTYSENGKDIAEIIRESFSLFLKKEILASAIPKSNCGDEWSLISRRSICT
ncbi:MAG: hypothetical protein IJ960_01395 [Oscillospiraceae bacterium]|nr:hypothetical protein [Oscillospiraceae bacterium]